MTWGTTVGSRVPPWPVSYAYIIFASPRYSSSWVRAPTARCTGTLSTRRTAAIGGNGRCAARAMAYASTGRRGATPVWRPRAGSPARPPRPGQPRGSGVHGCRRVAWTCGDVFPPDGHANQLPSGGWGRNKSRPSHTWDMRRALDTRCMPQRTLTFHDEARTVRLPRATVRDAHRDPADRCVPRAYGGHRRSLFHLLQVLSDFTAGGWGKTVENLNRLLRTSNLGTLTIGDNKLTWMPPPGTGTGEPIQIGATPPGLHASCSRRSAPGRRSNAWAKLCCGC